MIDSIIKSEENIWEALHDVKDPEIPVISVVDMGIVTKVIIDEKNDHAKVVMTPTFSGCPAIKLLEDLIQTRVEQMGFSKVDVETNFDVAWSSNMITDEGRAALKNFKLAPPPKHDGNPDPEMIMLATCPNCGSEKTTLKSPFGPTLCRSIHYCYDCLEAFEQFKPI